MALLGVTKTYPSTNPQPEPAHRPTQRPERSTSTRPTPITIAEDIPQRPIPSRRRILGTIKGSAGVRMLRRDMTNPVDTLTNARALIEENEWQEAYRVLDEADTGPGSSADHLALLGNSAWWSGHLDASIAAQERAYSAYISDGNPIGAAKMARKLRAAHFQKLEYNLAQGWSRVRAKLLEDAPTSVEHGWLLAAEVGRLTEDGKTDEALEVSEQLADLARELQSNDLEALELALRGLALANRGDYEEGFANLDEAAAVSMGSGISADAAGLVFCWVISGCIDFSEYSRASEHSLNANRWCARQDINGFPGVCRVYQASILRLRGSWHDAEREAIKARDELSEFGHLGAAREAFVEIGELHLRRGDLASAEEAFKRSHAMGSDPEPGMTLLRLELGDVAGALSGIKRALNDAVASYARARLLPAQAQAALAAGDADTASEAADELETISTNGSAALRAQALETRGRLELHRRGEGAAKTLAAAASLWATVDAPFEVARARTLLGEAYRMEGDASAADREFEAALEAFRALGAEGEAPKVAALLEPATPAVEAVKTFMFTDIVDSTPLVQAMGDEAWSRLLRWHDRTIRSCVDEAGGNEVKSTGDGFFLSFDNAATAVMCALGIQRRFAQHREDHGFAPRVRVGLHAATGMETEGDFSGQGVHEAARIGSSATGDEIVASATTTEGLDVETSNLRSVTLKGIPEPVEIVTIVWQ